MAPPGFDVWTYVRAIRLRDGAKFNSRD